MYRATVLMEGYSSHSRRTKSNAQRLAEAYGTSFREVDITAAVTQHFSDIGQNPQKLDVTYENCQARERTRLLWLPAQRQRPEVVPALAVLLLQLQRPCVRLQHVLHVAVQALRADPQPQRVPLGVARAVRAVIVDEVLHPRRQLYRLIEALLVRLRVLVQVGGDVPRHGLLCSLVYDDLTPFHLLRGSPCLPRLCREGACRDQHLILAAALPGL